MGLRLALSSKPRPSPDGASVAGKLRSRNSDCAYTRITTRRQRSFCHQTNPRYGQPAPRGSGFARGDGKCVP